MKLNIIRALAVAATIAGAVTAAPASIYVIGGLPAVGVTDWSRGGATMAP